jgi:hypothetical protein
MEKYLKDSVFLAAENGEKEGVDMKTAKARFTALNGIMLVMFSEDTMIHPKTTSQWGSEDAKGNPIAMED